MPMSIENQPSQDLISCEIITTDQIFPDLKKSIDTMETKPSDENENLSTVPTKNGGAKVNAECAYNTAVKNDNAPIDSSVIENELHSTHSDLHNKILETSNSIDLDNVPLKNLDDSGKRRKSSNSISTGIIKKRKLSVTENPLQLKINDNKIGDINNKMGISNGNVDDFGLEKETNGKSNTSTASSLTTSSPKQPQNGTFTNDTSDNEDNDEIDKDDEKNSTIYEDKDDVLDPEEQERQRLRKSAIEDLKNIELEFAKLRDQLHDDKLQRLYAEMEMCKQGTHPELIAFCESSNERLQNHLERLKLKRRYQLQCIDNQTVARRISIHQQFLYYQADFREKLLSTTTENWYKVNRERRSMDSVVPDIGIRVPKDRESQIEDRILQNNEISNLVGLQKYFGFPLPPEMKPLSEEEADDDLKLMNFQLQQQQQKQKQQTFQYFPPFHLP